MVSNVSRRGVFPARKRLLQRGIEGRQILQIDPWRRLWAEEMPCCCPARGAARLFFRLRVPENGSSCSVLTSTTDKNWAAIMPENASAHRKLSMGSPPNAL